MNIRNLILSASCIAILSTPVSAEWSNRSYGSNTSIQKQLERLERENEQLRNAISQMRRNGTKLSNQPKTTSNDSRVQALVEENKRLFKELEIQKSKSVDNSAVNKIYSLNRENDRLSVQLNALQETNKRLQNEVSGLKKQQTRIQSTDNGDLKAEISQLKKEANQLRSENNQTFERSSSEISSLKSQIKELENKNKSLISNNKTHELETEIADLKTQNQLLKTNKNNEYKNEVSYYENEINKIKNENLTLLDKIKKVTSEKDGMVKQVNALKSKPEVKDQSEKLALLEAQNNSLRETIKAQTATLSNHDNAVNRAEALTSENLRLKRQLELANNAKTSNDDTAQSLVKKNQELISELNEQKQQLANIDGLKETIRQLRSQNDTFQTKIGKSNQHENEIIALKQKSKGLQADLEKERSLISEYRAEITKLQQQTNTAEPSNEEMVTALRLENQELKARIDLMASKNSKTSVVFQKEDMGREGSAERLLDVQPEKSGVSYIQKQTEIIERDIRVVETSYPKVDKVKPLLGNKGEHIYEAVKPEPVAVEKMQPSLLGAEALLQQEPKPLSSKN